MVIHPTITYFINGIYIQFDFLNSTHLNKIEIEKKLGILGQIIKSFLTN
jgi:hypothetical protein